MEIYHHIVKADSIKKLGAECQSEYRRFNRQTTAFYPSTISPHPIPNRARYFLKRSASLEVFFPCRET